MPIPSFVDTLRLVAILLAFAGALGCVPPGRGPSAADSASEDPLIGCYQLEIGRWEPERVPDNAPYQTPPGTFRLLATSEGGMQLVRPTIPSPPPLDRGIPNASWQRVETDSLRVYWSNGILGVGLHLEIAGDTLEGVARAFTDFVTGLPWPQAAAVARRTPCTEMD